MPIRYVCKCAALAHSHTCHRHRIVDIAHIPLPHRHACMKISKPHTSPPKQDPARGGLHVLSKHVPDMSPICYTFKY